MNRCKTCRHWGDCGICDSDKFVYIRDEPVPPDGIGCMDAEGYNAIMHTGPDFGCVHWEAEEKVCETCKHWIFESGSTGDCRSNNIYYIVEGSTFRTEPRFGCVHWEEKDE